MYEPGCMESTRRARSETRILEVNATGLTVGIYALNNPIT